MLHTKEGVMLSMVVPYWNEESVLVKRYRELSKFLRLNFSSYEIIFVNDGSQDDSLKKLKHSIKLDRNVKLITYSKNKGRGFAVKKGLKIAQGDVVGYIDADLEIKPKYIKKCYLLLNQCDVAIISKYVQGASVKTHPVRSLSSKFLNLFTHFVLGITVKDTQAGLKLFKKKVVLDVLKHIKDKEWFFDIELLFYVQKKGYRVKEVPIRLTYGMEGFRVSFVKGYVLSFVKICMLKFRDVFHK